MTGQDLAVIALCISSFALGFNLAHFLHLLGKIRGGDE